MSAEQVEEVRGGGRRGPDRELYWHGVQEVYYRRGTPRTVAWVHVRLVR